MFDRDYIITEIRRTAEENGGRPLGSTRFSSETGIPAIYWNGKIWARFGDALQEAGYPPNEFRSAYDDDFPLQKLVELVRELNHFPVSRELQRKAHDDPDFPSHSPFKRIGPTKRDLAARVLQYCEKQGSIGYEDVLAICAPVADIVSANKQVRGPSAKLAEMGFVYLIKSGRHYKIGRSNAAGRRECELAIQLPERSKTIHVIKTDDPVGIESYWHRRFENKRRNGEWFELDSEDVAAFKLRKKFM